MCLANKFLTRFEELSNEMEKEYKRLKRLNSEYDKKMNNFYHKLEVVKFNAAEGYYLAKEMQDIARQRRVIKNELYKLQAVADRMDLKLIIDKSNTTRKVLNKIHKDESSDKHYVKEWAHNYRVEDLQVH